MLHLLWGGKSVCCTALEQQCMQQQQHSSQMLLALRALCDAYTVMSDDLCGPHSCAYMPAVCTMLVHVPCALFICTSRSMHMKHEALPARVSIGETWIGIELFRRPGLSCRRVPQLRGSNLKVRATLVLNTPVKSFIHSCVTNSKKLEEVCGLPGGPAR